jgi:hypothetical protein
MKITKFQLKQILLEDLGKTDSALLSAIGLLAQKIDNLDVSIDYLAGAVTGESPATLGYAQNTLGRFARTVKPARLNKPDRMNEIEDIIEQEIEAVLSEKEKYKKSFYKAKEKRADHLIDKGVPEDVAYGVADKQMAKDGKKKKK